MVRTLIVLTLAVSATAASAADDPFPRGEIQERLDKEPTFTFQTSKRPVDLEFCVANVLSKMAVPSAFTDGPNRSIVTASLGKVIAAIELNGYPTSTTVIGHIYGKGWDDRMRDRIHACL